MEKITTKNIISFEVDLKTAKDFEDLIFKLENLGVYMDFNFKIDSNFTNEESRLIHIEEINKKITWDTIFKKKHHYFESKIVTVNLEDNPALYSIFSAIYLNKMTNLIYDFYEGSDAIYVSFFMNNLFSEKYIEEKSELNYDLSEDYVDLDDIDVF